MSVKAINWALELPIPPGPKLVLVVLADYADEYGFAFPGIDTIARRASVSERTAIRILAELEESGHLTRERRHLESGKRTSNGYRLQPDQVTNRHVTNEADHLPTVSPTGEPSVEEPSVKKRRASVMPVDWMPSNAHMMLAADLKVDADVEAEKFKDWVLANGIVQADWEARFRNWLRTAAERPRQRPDDRGPGFRRGSRDDEIRSVVQGSLGLDDMPRGIER